MCRDEALHSTYIPPADIAKSISLVKFTKNSTIHYSQLWFKFVWYNLLWYISEFI